MTQYTDTDRLNFLLRYIRVDDVGTEFYVPGIVIREEDLETDLTWSKHCDAEGRQRHIFPANFTSLGLREIIDEAIRENS